MRALLIAAGANSLLKAVLAVALGGHAMQRPVVLVLGATVICAAGAAWLL